MKLAVIADIAFEYFAIVEIIDFAFAAEAFFSCCAIVGTANIKSKDNNIYLYLFSFITNYFATRIQPNMISATPIQRVNGIVS